MSSPLVRLLQQAERHLQSGDLQAARAACEQALRKAPRHPDALMLGGVVDIALGAPARALPLLERAVAADPRHGAALEHLGLALLMLGRFAEAEAPLARAAAMRGAPPSVHMRLGIAMLEQGRAAQAVPVLERAAAAMPDDVDALLNLGRAHAATGDTAQAGAAFETALRLDARRPEPAHNLGILALERGDVAGAARHFEQALAVAPDHVDARLGLASCLQTQSRFDDAIAALRTGLSRLPRDPRLGSELARALALGDEPAAAHRQYTQVLAHAPDHAPAHEGLASACLALGRLSEAVAHLRRTLQLEPGNAPVAAALASTLFQTGLLEEARAAAAACIDMAPDSAGAYGTLANVCVAQGDLSRAIETLEQGWARTSSSPLLGMLAYLLRQACDWTRWTQVWQLIEPLLEDGAPLGSPFWLLCEPVSAQRLLAYTRAWASARFGRIPARPAGTVACAGRRLRIGYLSSDLHEHATAYLIADVIERHDRSRFEIHAYSHGPDDGSPMRTRLKSAFEHFVDIAHLPDDDAAERIRRDGLDVLVDLKGYTLGDRLTIMARRPCALQVTWLGYPGSTGAPFMDYLVADPQVVPAGSEAAYSERIARMPVCYQPNDRARAVAEARDRADYGLPAGAWVFCCFNQTYKITPAIFAMWMRLLQRVPGSVLWLLESNALAAGNLAQAAKAAGIDEARLVFAPRLPNAQHLARYRVADLALDTFPYTSHTTMSDALWCGCPAPALCGETFAARVSSSLVAAAGLPDLVASTPQAYEALALRIVNEPGYRADIRARLARARDAAPLFDAGRFARDLEALFEHMIREAPRSGS